LKDSRDSIFAKMMRSDIFVVTMSIVCCYIVHGTNAKGVNVLAERMTGPKCDPICASDEHLIPITACANKNPSNGCGPWYHDLLDEGLSAISSHHSDQCCDQHDACYSSCTEAKATCDKNFQDCLHGLYNVYGTSVKLLGCDPFKKSKLRYCKCEKKNSGKTSSNEACPW